MTPVERAEEVLTLARAFLEEMKASRDIVTVSQAEVIYHTLREAESWLAGCRLLLDPTGTTGSS